MSAFMQPYDPLNDEAVFAHWECIARYNQCERDIQRFLPDGWKSPWVRVDQRNPAGGLAYYWCTLGYAQPSAFSGVNWSDYE